MRILTSSEDMNTGIDPVRGAYVKIYKPYHIIPILTLETSLTGYKLAITIKVKDEN